MGLEEGFWLLAISRVDSIECLRIHSLFTVVFEYEAGLGIPKEWGRIEGNESGLRAKEL